MESNAERMQRIISIFFIEAIDSGDCRLKRVNIDMVTRKVIFEYFWRILSFLIFLNSYKESKYVVESRSTKSKR